eukprot:175159-Amphidinium_carterae.2
MHTVACESCSSCVYRTASVDPLGTVALQSDSLLLPTAASLMKSGWHSSYVACACAQESPKMIYAGCATARTHSMSLIRFTGRIWAARPQCKVVVVVEVEAAIQLHSWAEYQAGAAVQVPVVGLRNPTPLKTFSMPRQQTSYLSKSCAVLTQLDLPKS